MDVLYNNVTYDISSNCFVTLNGIYMYYLAINNRTIQLLKYDKNYGLDSLTFDYLYSALSLLLNFTPIGW